MRFSTACSIRLRVLLVLSISIFYDRRTLEHSVESAARCIGSCGEHGSRIIKTKKKEK